jgi:signal transduction histidine kinase
VRDISLERDLQAQLRQAHRMEAIGQLCAGVAHDFNNLLQGIISHLELVDDDIVPLPTRGKIGTAIRLAEQGGALVQQLLSFARKQLLLPQDIDLHDFLEDFHRLLSRTLDPRIRIRLRIAPGLKTLWADPNHLRSALLNVTINARDAMLSGGNLILEAEYEGSSEDSVVFRITDTGCGIAPDDLPRVCEPFFSTKSLNGTGLGLSMVHGFAKQSGGDLRIASELGRGTCVEMSLPAHSDRAKAAA